MDAEANAITMQDGVVFAGGQELIMTTDRAVWHVWPCPVAEIMDIHIELPLLIACGGKRVAISYLRDRGREWRTFELEEDAACITSWRHHIFIGTTNGRLFEIQVKCKLGLLERLHLRKPRLELGELQERTWLSGEPDAICWCGDE